MIDQLHAIIQALQAGKQEPNQQDMVVPPVQGDTRSWVMPDQPGFYPGMKPPFMHVNDVQGTQSTMPAYNPSFDQRFNDESNAAWKQNDKLLSVPDSPMLNGLVQTGLMKREQGVWEPAKHPDRYDFTKQNGR